MKMDVQRRKALGLMGRTGTAVFVGLVSVLVVEGVRADETSWSRFRGDDGQGRVLDASAPVTWSSTENLKWRTDVPGSGWSSPVIRNGKIYLTSARLDADEQPESLRVLCFDAGDGSLVWDREALSVSGSSTKHGKNSHASSTPVVTDEFIYAHFGHMGTACLDLDGSVKWKQTRLGYAPVHGNGSSPVLVGDKLVFSADGEKNPSIIALNAATGKLIWKTERQTDANRKFSFSTPAVTTVDGNVQLVSPASGAVFGYDPSDGRELWRVDYGQGFSVVPNPPVGHGHVYVATGFMRPNLLAIRLGGRGNVTDTHITWETSRSVPKTPSMVLAGGELYFVADGGIVSCVDARTGKRHWQDRVRGNVSASPVIVGQYLYVPTEEGKVYVLATGKEFEVRAENDFGERIFASPAVTGNALVIRTETRLYRIEG